MPRVLFVFFLIFCLSQNQASDFEFQGGVFAKDKAVFRGALIRKTPLLFPGLALSYKKKFFLRGPRLIYQHFDRKDSHLLNLRFYLFNDEDSFLNLLRNKKESFRTQRASSLHSDIEYRYKFGYRKLFALGALLSYELKEYQAYYTELLSTAPLLPFTSLQFKISSAPQKTHRYLYGQSAEAGWGYSEWSLNFFFPPKWLPWEGVLLAQFSRSKILRKKNQRAEFILGTDENYSVSLSAFFQLF